MKGLHASSTAAKTLFSGWDSWTIRAIEEAKEFMVKTIKDKNAQVIEVTSVIAAGDLELPFGDEEDDHEPETSVESPPPPSIRLKRLRKRTVVVYVAAKPAVAPTTTSDTDEELTEAFEADEKEKKVMEGPQEKTKEEDIPAEVIAESIALVKKQQETQSAELTSFELALFDDMEAEHSTAIP
ncbi:unnamed protein product [Prunus armeniaca]